MKYLLIITGWLLCLPAILLGPIAKKTSVDTDRPWVDGVFINVWRAYKKYDTKSWLRRMVGIYHNPRITIQYLKILTNKQSVRLIGDTGINVTDINQFHDVQTTHEHHRKRVSDIRSGKVPASEYGSMIVVNNIVHDGNHRLSAFKEAGYSGSIKVKYWVSI